MAEAPGLQCPPAGRQGTHALEDDRRKDWVISAALATHTARDPSHPLCRKIGQFDPSTAGAGFQSKQWSSFTDSRCLPLWTEIWGQEGRREEEGQERNRFGPAGVVRESPEALLRPARVPAGPVP